MHSRYKELDAYKRAVRLADELHRAIRRWPDADRGTLGDQLMRSADSIGGNIAESAGRWTKTERRRFLLNARASLYETEHWIDRAVARNLTLPKSASELEGMARPLSGLIKRHS